MYTSILWAALLGPGAAAPQSVAVDTPVWQDNYTTACQSSQQQNKPLAVFIGSGKQGWNRVSQENQLTAAAQKTLADHYVCVYVDGDLASGKQLAEEFSLEQGMVLSSRDGKTQAFRHSGAIANQDLDAALKRHLNDPPVVASEPVEQPRFSYSYPPATTTAPPITNPSNLGSFGGFGGGSFGGGSVRSSGGGSC